MAAYSIKDLENLTGIQQRIVIVRAILKDADVIILDEATSALDSDREKKYLSSCAGCIPKKL